MQGTQLDMASTATGSMGKYGDKLEGARCARAGACIVIYGRFSLYIYCHIRAVDIPCILSYKGDFLSLYIYCHTTAVAPPYIVVRGRSWAAMPPLGWAQIIAFIAALDSAALQEGLPESPPTAWSLGLQRSVVAIFSLYILSSKGDFHSVYCHIRAIFTLYIVIYGRFSLYILSYKGG